MKNKYYKTMNKSVFDKKPYIFEVAVWTGKKFIYCYNDSIRIMDLNYALCPESEYTPTTKKVFDQFMAKTMQTINEAINPIKTKK